MDGNQTFLPSHHDNFLLTTHSDKLTTFPKKKFLTDLPPIYDKKSFSSNFRV